MLKEGARTCDVCGIEIPEGQKFNRERFFGHKQIPRETLEKLGWQTDEQGALVMHICLECYLSMGSLSRTSGIQ